MLTADECSRLSGRSLDLVRRWCRDGRVTGATFVCGVWMIPAAGVDELRSIPRRNRRRPLAA